LADGKDYYDSLTKGENNQMKSFTNWSWYKGTRYTPLRI